MFIFCYWMFKMEPWEKREMKVPMVCLAPIELMGEVILVHLIYQLWTLLS